MNPIWHSVVLVGFSNLGPGGAMTFGILVGIPVAELTVDFESTIVG